MFRFIHMNIFLWISLIVNVLIIPSMIHIYSQSKHVGLSQQGQSIPCEGNQIVKLVSHQTLNERYKASHLDHRNLEIWEKKTWFIWYFYPFKFSLEGQNKKWTRNGREMDNKWKEMNKKWTRNWQEMNKQWTRNSSPILYFYTVCVEGKDTFWMNLFESKSSTAS